MPDWLLHIGAADLVGQPRRRWDSRWLLLGAVLPDAISRVASAAIHVVPGLRVLTSVELGICLGLLHTPFAVALLAAALVCLAANRGDAARGLGLGATLHFAMDLLQRSWGSGTCLLFPFELRPFSLQVLWYDQVGVHAAVVVAAIYLAVVLHRRQPSRAAALAPWRLRRAAGALVCIGAALVTPVLVLPRALAMNFGNLLLARNPADYEGASVQIAVTVVERVEGSTAWIDEADTLLPVEWSGTPPLEAGAVVSIQGVFRAGTVHATAVFVHDYVFKALASLAGVAVLVLVWWPARASPLLHAAHT